ncbi:hypothetical protein LF41_2386 [Lysobacter dokdonensis DS-58]|uniref:Uncharacterized protein n=1 Tax=Lysobacter dokdonensis DS-58 TaxID=1300345 RepID=A0A0A2X3P2_9GAMM|nr:hypothetical protein [Lysobacter dokdonensis]KGQ19879.1 hypothetical protein LF41_2386 [Lysobacter dokdonensis DS-58]
MREQINPAFWIEAIRIAMHTTDCAVKQQTLANAADKLEAYIDGLRSDYFALADAYVERKP